MWGEADGRTDKRLASIQSWKETGDFEMNPSANVAMYPDRACFPPPPKKPLKQDDARMSGQGRALEGADAAAEAQ